MTTSLTAILTCFLLIHCHPPKRPVQVTGEYRIENALPKGYVTDGSVDYTSYVQSAIDKYSKLIFPPFPIRVNEKGLTIINAANKTLTFSKGSKIVLDHSSRPNYNIIIIYRSSKITLVNPVIIGDRYKHTGKGEWGMGIGIYSSSNISITNPRVSNCFGDGIYLAASDNHVTNTNVTITNAVCDSNRRNGISVISANGLQIISPRLTNSNGTLPMAGLDIEPDSTTDEAQNIMISNPVTENNLGTGIQIGLTNLHGTGAKQVSIVINNPVDNNAPLGMEIASRNTNDANTGSLTGTININNPVWSNNSEMCLRARWLLEPGIKLVVFKPTVTKNGEKVDDQGRLQSVLADSFGSGTLYELVFN